MFRRTIVDRGIDDGRSGVHFKVNGYERLVTVSEDAAELSVRRFRAD